MSEWTSGLILPSREAQESSPEFDSTPSSSDTAAGAGLSLALAVLNEKLKAGALDREDLIRRIVEQAAAATGAKGVALALRRESDGAVVCCASSGDMAPPPGTVLNQSSGFTAECLRTRTLLVCSDAESDARVDRAACNRLGVRSIVAAPVEDGEYVGGVLEALSDRASAFSKPQVEVLLTLACFARSAMSGSPVGSSPVSRATNVVVEQKLPEIREVAIPAAKVIKAREPVRAPFNRRAMLTYIAAAGAMVTLIAISIFLLEGRRPSDNEEAAAQPPTQQEGNGLGAAPVRRAIPRPRAALRIEDARTTGKPVVDKASAVERVRSEDREAVVSPADKPAPVPAAGTAEADSASPADILSAPAQPSTQLVSVLSVPPNIPRIGTRISEGAIPPKLERRVEPTYPLQAKQLRVEGSVVLRAEISEEGKVGQVQVLNGSSLLAPAAVKAVRQWRYQPSQLNHRPVASTTDVTVVFRLQ
jgi:TonB family protein